MCRKKPEPRCAGHLLPELEAAMHHYCQAYPDGPSPCVLLTADLAGEQRIGRLHAAVALGKRMVHDAESEQDRAEAEAYLAAARARLAQRWAERAGTARAAALSPDEQAQWDKAEHDRQYAEERQTAHELAADVAWGVDDTRAEHHNQIAAHYREEAETHAQAQAAILAGARARRSAATPAGAIPVALHPQARRLATYGQWDEDQLVTRDQAAELLGTDTAGMAELERQGRLPVALEGDSHRGRPTVYQFGDVAALAGPLPPPARSTRAVLQEHTRWLRQAESARIAALRELEARRNGAQEHLAA